MIASLLVKKLRLCPSTPYTVLRLMVSNLWCFVADKDHPLMPSGEMLGLSDQLLTKSNAGLQILANGKLAWQQLADNWCPTYNRIREVNQVNGILSSKSSMKVEEIHDMTTAMNRSIR